MFESREFSACKGSVHLRVVAYRPVHQPLPAGHLRVVVQVVVCGAPVAEDPLHIEIMSAADLEHAMEISRTEGWLIQPWPAPEVDIHQNKSTRRHAA